MRKYIDLIEDRTKPNSVVDNPAFRAWFRNSHLVDETGAPIVLYHGSSKTFDAFKLPGRSEYRPKAIFFATSPEVANYFTYGLGSVYPVYVRAEKTFDYREPGDCEALRKFLSTGFETKVPGALYSVDAAIRFLEGGDFGIIEQPRVQSWIKRKYDSFYVTESNGLLNIGVFRPNQAKSIYNFGTFRDDSDNISETT